MKMDRKERRKQIRVLTADLRNAQRLYIYWRNYDNAGLHLTEEYIEQQMETAQAEWDRLLAELAEIRKQ